MSGVWDFNQPARNWVADCIENFQKMIDDGEEPVLNLTLYGANFEFKYKPEPKHHCQNGTGDVCLAGAHDGVCCPDDSCDIDDEVRKPA